MKNISQIKAEPHPLQKTIKERKIPMWKLRKALGGSPSEAKLSRLLNGIDQMDLKLEKKIKNLIEV